ncbi:ABC transporter ATP-binding protein [Nocardioides sp. 31GB23]|uniref:ABC-type nitrate/sulfonate/bicarbonate transport system ATPase subunit n=1 Tax=Nocardioides salarius TaxID=374513 RepID=A0ABS2MBC9_9ACTN|nr:ABC transporter ATP-binding protein [Nocardioides salarius]MBM7508495.1 ABC-type nitrate/sulfonate/bicarbonate transport system ATPase subunit [Nocardioides salarius]
MANVDITGLSKHFDSLSVFDDVDLHVGDNEFVSILGPSGCGKTTLLRIVAGIEERTSGSVLVDGDEVERPRPDTTLVFQNFRLLPWRTVEDNVAYGLRLRGKSKAESRAAAQPYIAMVGLEGREKKYPYQLSGGMQQRVGLARALAIKPGTLLMDEPFGALDAQTRELMQDELLRIWSNDKRTVIFVTHSIDEAIVLSDRVIVMQSNPGRIVEDITIPFERPRTPTAIRTDPRFARLRAEMWSLLRQEPLSTELSPELLNGVSGE